MHDSANIMDIFLIPWSLFCCACMAFGILQGIIDFFKQIAVKMPFRKKLEELFWRLLCLPLCLAALAMCWMLFSARVEAVADLFHIKNSNASTETLITATPTPTPAPVTRPYTFTLTHNIIEGRTDCKWTFTQSVNGEHVNNTNTVNLVPGATIHLGTSIKETSGTYAAGSDACKLENPPTGTFSIRRTIDAANAGSVIARWEVVYTFTPQDNYKAESQDAYWAQESENYSGRWGTDDTTDDVIGSLDETVYWVPDGKSYHFDSNCPSLSRSPEIYEGTLQEAIEEGKTDPCNNCAW